MPTTIASRIPGRTIYPYDLLDEMQERHDLTRKDAHDSIHAFLAQVAEIDGEDAVVVDRKPIRPGLLTDNPNDLDIYYWVTITDTAAETIREAFAAAYADA